MPSRLPRLAFGEPVAQLCDDVDRLRASQSVAMQAVRRYEPIGNAQSFRQKSAAMQVGGLRLVAASHTPVFVDAGESDDVTLIVPLHGWSTSVIGGREYRWQAGHAAMFLPRTPRSGACGVRSTLTIGLDPVRLEQAARWISGPDADAAVDLRFGVPRLVPLERPGMSFTRQLRRLSAWIDDSLTAPAWLSHLGLDEVVYRLVAAMLLVDVPQSPEAAIGNPRRAVDAACMFIQCNLDKPIKLADLERVSGLKTRALQLAFLRSVGMSPREWILDRRLEEARRRLCAAGPETTITGVANACGFTRHSAFAAAYKSRFGELPSTTLDRSGLAER
ncbi:MAG: hypothetical protein RLZZ440_219 [Planctomycetota bacterium]|jgi:AraC-like DNA-binding protein